MSFKLPSSYAYQPSSLGNSSQAINYGARPEGQDLFDRAVTRCEQDYKACLDNRYNCPQRCDEAYQRCLGKIVTGK